MKSDLPSDVASRMVNGEHDMCKQREREKKRIHLCVTGIPGQQAAELEVGVGKAATRAGSVQSRSQKQLPGAPR